MARQNNNPGTSGIAGATIAAYTLVRRNTSDQLVNTAANENAIGIATQDAVLNDVMGVRSFNAGLEHKVKVNGTVAIAIDDVLVAAANGKAIKLPGTTGTYYQIGRAQEPSTADGDIITVAAVGVGMKHVVP